MKIGIMQPYFFPYIGYWQLIKSVDKFVVYDDVNYIKQGWINRNVILINKIEIFITLAISKASSFKKINEHDIIDDRQKLIKTIKQAYSKAPYFDSIMPVMVSILEYSSNNLAEFLTNSIVQISRLLKIKTEFLVSSSMAKDNALKGEEKVIDICNRLKGTAYINSPGGKKLYETEHFARHGINLQFLKPTLSECIECRNVNLNLSIIDILMNHSLHEIETFLKAYKLETKEE